MAHHHEHHHARRPRRRSAGILTVFLMLMTLGFTFPAAEAGAVNFSPALPTTDDPLDWINYYRATAGLGSVTESSSLAAGAEAHAEYLVENQALVLAAGTPHTESIPPGTAAGLAASSGNITRSSSPSRPNRDSIESLMAAPFHTLGFIDPELGTVGTGTYVNANQTDQYKSAMVVDINSGSSVNAPSGVFPIVWPENGTIVPLTRYSGSETPDPLTACAGYANPVGLPLVVQFASSPNITSHTLRVNGTLVSNCLAEASDYPVGSTARAILQSKNAVFVIPRNPLPGGASVQLVINSSNQPQVSSTFTAYDRPDDPNYLTSGGASVGQTSVTLGWSAPSYTGGLPITHFEVEARKVGSDAIYTTTRPASSASGTVSNLPAGVYEVTVHAHNAAGSSNTPWFFTLTVKGPATDFTALTPARLLDTRNGNGGFFGKLGPNGSLDLQVTGRGGVPSSGVSAVVLNVTVTGGTAGSHLTVHPSGTPTPLASSLNFAAGETAPNHVTTKLSNSGKATIVNAGGATHVIADVVGWFDTGGTNDEFTPVSPARILDSRSGNGLSGAFPGGVARALQVTGRGGVPSSGVSAVVVNLTATQPSAASHVTAWPTGQSRPTTSNLNVVAGQTRPNLVTVKVGTGGRINLENAAGTVHLIADVVGWYNTGSSTGGSFHSLEPTRVLDTRTTIGVSAASKVGAGSVVELDLNGVGGVPKSATNSGVPLGAVSAVVLNVTVTAPSGASHLTVYPADESLPTTSNLNYPASKTIANQVIVKVSDDGKIRLRNHAGAVHVIADVVGWYD